MNHLFRIITTVASLIAASACTPKQAGTFCNPVIRGDVADPTVIMIGDSYYAAGTSSEWAPQYPLFKSHDLVNWEQIGHVFDNKPEWTLGSFWAPEFFAKDGKVFCYYTARRKSDGISFIGVAVTDDIEKGFTDRGELITIGTEDIDAFVFEENGVMNVSWKAYGLDKRPVELLSSKLSADGLSLEGEIISLLRDDENIGMEGQAIFREGDWYYLLYSARGCCGKGSDYEVRVARSRSYEGPYEKYDNNPILKGGEGSDFMSIGHGTVVQVPGGRRFYLCHAYEKDERFLCGRQPVLHELVVGGDGWPHFVSSRTGDNGEALACREQELPFRKSVWNKPVLDFIDNFDSDDINVSWTWNYRYSDVSAKCEGGVLYLAGVPAADSYLGEVAIRDSEGESYNGAALCLRPAAPDYTIETMLHTDPAVKAGLTFYGGNNAYLFFGNDNGNIVLSLRRGRNNMDFTKLPLSDADLYLKAEVASGSKISCSWSSDGKSWNLVETETGDISGLIQWDRVFRPGIISMATPVQPAAFEYFKISYGE
ncbi:MAG: family 43 glycosylhydrolase [Bacteroidales bacterium]|nr:family 43 glycosylhydrolase [Bacteroidales bacterium]